MVAVPSSTKEERKAVETLLTLGCVDAGKLPEWVWMRAVAACLRKHTYEFEPIASRRRGKRGTKYDGAKELRDRVRSHLGIDRLPSGMGEKLERWGAAWVEKVSARLKRAEVEHPASIRKKVVWEGVRRRAEATLKRWGIEKRLIRASGETSYLAVDYQPPYVQLEARPQPPYVQLEARPKYADGWAMLKCVRTDTGQIDVDVRVTAAIRPSWYGRVYKRGIAIVADCFVVDVVGYGPAKGGECLIVKCAVPGVGFQVSMQNRAVYRTVDGARGARFITAEEEATLRTGSWFEYEKVKEN